MGTARIYSAAVAPDSKLIGTARSLAGRSLRRARDAFGAGRITECTERIVELNAQVSGLTEHITLLNAEVDRLNTEVGPLRDERDAANARIAELSDLAAIDSVTRWIRHATLYARPLISVVVPTYDRPPLLERAIVSVLSQRYEHWELIVVGDGDPGGARAVVEASADSRIRYAEIPRSGVAAARNVALELAAGELITYLDDDNIMDSEWLYAVAWAFEQRPDVQVLYGAFVIDDVLRLNGSGPGALPRSFLHRFDREALNRANLADMGAIAHRAGLDGAWFDESLREMGDWDLLLRLTAEAKPLVLPAISHYYTTDAPHRLTHGPTHDRDRATVLARAVTPPS